LGADVLEDFLPYGVGMAEPLLETASIEELLARARAGDGAAENALFARLHARVLALAKKRIWDQDAARDIAQETMRTALEKYREADLARGLLPWVFTILHHKVGNHLKRRRAQHQLFDDGLAPPGAAWELRTPDEAGYVELLASLEKALAQLPEECRKIFRLLLGGASRREICSAFRGEPMGTIDSRLSRCRTRLLAHLEESSRRR
jgi:RNA polymerase sigma-70 factor (ECF subfamily)